MVKYQCKSNTKQQNMNSDDGDHLSAFQFFEQFPNEQSAIDFLEDERWPDGPICPRCGSDYTRRMKNQNRHMCNGCRKPFSVRTGTIFQNSKVPLRKWLYAMYLIQISRKGVSSIQLGKELGITQKTAWFMLHRIRESMDPGIEKLSGEVEVDEAYVGGAEKNKHAKKNLHKNWLQGKQIVIGFRERGENGRIVLRPIPSSQQVLIEDEVLFVVEEGSTIYSDEGKGFFNLDNWYQHSTVSHGRGEYVREEVTTNSIESVWEVVKRAYKGIYHQWSPKHGHRYLNEVAYRLTEGHVNVPIMIRVKRLSQRAFKVTLTYRELTHE